MKKTITAKDKEKYTEDIATIKSLLMAVEEKPIIEIWAFFTWGGLILLGTLFHFILASFYAVDVYDILLYMWLPVLLIASFLETMAWIRRMSREALPFFSKPMIKFWLTFIGSCTGLMFTIYIFILSGSFAYLPVLILISFAILYFLYAQMLYLVQYIYGYLLLFAAFILYIIWPGINAQFIAAGLVLGTAFILTGLSYRKKQAENA